MQIIEFIREGVALLAPLYGEREAKAIALRLLQEVAGLNNYIHLTEPQAAIREKAVSAGQSAGQSAGSFGLAAEQRLQECLRELATGRPLQYVLGYAWFMEHKFRVCEGVLIPRPETEELVRYILKRSFSTPGGPGAALPHPLTVLDICTGSGCIAWSLAVGFGAGVQVYGCDISNRALEIAGEQEISGDHGVFLSGNRGGIHRTGPRFFHCDVLGDDAAKGIAANGAEKYDVIVSNPPYVCDSERAQMHKNVLEFEPELALFVPDTDPLLFYRKIAELAARLLKPGGRLYFEINERFGVQVVECMEHEGLLQCRVLQDIHGKDRFAEGLLPF